MRKTGYLVALGALLLAAGCRKEVEKLVVQEVEKQYSWAEVKQFYGLEKVIMSMGRDASSLYLQTPGTLGVITPVKTATSRGYLARVSAGLPGDVFVRVPLAPTFIALPVPNRDTLMRLVRTTAPVASTYEAQLNLKQLDPQAKRLILSTRPWQPFGAVNRNNYLLFGYSAGDGTDIRLVLAQVSLFAGEQLRAPALTVRIAPPPGQAYAAIRWITAIDDYFLVQCDGGLFKVRENGSAYRVFGSNTTDICYKWQGRLYAVEEYNSVLLSDDDGETWRRATGTPDIFDFTSYHPMGDSLVVVRHSTGYDQLFTLRWQGSSYRTRLLKTDGLERREISDLVLLGDTVYLGTSSGLFKRPLGKFFESKP